MPDIILESWGAPPERQAPQQPAGSLLQMPPPPPSAAGGANVNQKIFRDEVSKDLAKEKVKILEAGLGAHDYLKLLEPAKDELAKMPDSVFGPWQGKHTYNDYVRAPIAAVTSPLGDPTGMTADMEHMSKKQALVIQLGTQKFREQFGARPTQMEFGKALEMVGGDAPNSKSFNANLDANAKSSYSTLEKAVRDGGLNVAELDPSIVTRGLMKGALNPQFFPHQAAMLDEARRRGLVK